MTKKRIFSLLMPLFLLIMSPLASADVYEVNLMPCTLELCGAAGTATLAEGEVSVSDSGLVEVEVKGSSLVNTPLTVIFRDFFGIETAIGTFSTDANGSYDDDGQDAPLGTLVANNAMGVFLISDAAGVRHFVTGFSTTGAAVCPEAGDDDCDDVSDDIDDDDDNDGVSDSLDANPTQANMFDGVSTSPELTAEYKAKIAAEKATTRTQMNALKRASAARGQKIRDDYMQRKNDPGMN